MNRPTEEMIERGKLVDSVEAAPGSMGGAEPWSKEIWRIDGRLWVRHNVREYDLPDDWEDDECEEGEPVADPGWIWESRREEKPSWRVLAACVASSCSFTAIYSGAPILGCSYDGWRGRAVVACWTAIESDGEFALSCADDLLSLSDAQIEVLDAHYGEGLRDPRFRTDYQAFLAARDRACRILYIELLGDLPLAEAGDVNVLVWGRHFFDDVVQRFAQRRESFLDVWRQRVAALLNRDEEALAELIRAEAREVASADFDAVERTGCSDPASQITVWAFRLSPVVYGVWREDGLESDIHTLDLSSFSGRAANEPRELAEDVEDMHADLTTVSFVPADLPDLTDAMEKLGGQLKVDWKTIA